MAVSNGLFGNYEGKLGNLVAYTLNGKNVVRKIGINNKPLSTAQLGVRQKIALITLFLKPTFAFIKVGFGLEVKGTDQNSHNAAISYNTKHATQGTYPDISINYSKVLVSKGNLEPALNPVLKLIGNKLEFSWAVAPDMDWGIKNDRAMLLVYNPELHEAVYLLSGSRRSSGKDIFELPESYPGKQLHVYISFTSNDGNQISNSTYIPYQYNS